MKITSADYETRSARLEMAENAFTNSIKITAHPVQMQILRIAFEYLERNSLKE
jgi:hypothetical protein